VSCIINLLLNDDSRVVNKLETSLTDNARVFTYDRHMFIVQATGVKKAHQPQSQRSILILYDPVYERKIFTGLAVVFFTSVNIVVVA
jgi:hypothetical protein